MDYFESLAELHLADIVNYALISVFTLILISFTRWLINYVKLVRVVNKLEGMPMLPFIGNVHQISFKREDLLKNMIKISNDAKSPIFRFWNGIHPSVNFHKADLLEALFSGSKNNDKAFEYTFLHPWLKQGLLTSGGSKWLTRRRLITPTFHFEILNDFMQIMNEQADILIDVLAELSKNDKEVNIFKKIGLCALDIICETAMGQNVNAQTEVDSEYVKAVEGISERIVDRINKPYMWPDFIYFRTSESREHEKYLKILHGFTRKVILERNTEFDPVNFRTQKRIAFLDMLLKAKSEDDSLTFDDIQEEVDTFMFEGHDTTTAAMSWACQLIGSHPDVQAKLHDEVDRVFGSSNAQLKMEDLGELKYLECVIKESLRIYPSVPGFSRTISEDQEIGGYKVPKGATATVLTYIVHRDERYFPEPEKFDPDRFLPENSADRHAYAYIPFSAGRRNCIGQRFALMEEKILLANLLRRFELEPLDETKNIVPIAELILRPKGGIRMKLKLRQTTEN